MNTKNVSATNVRVNLTEVISELDASNRVAITKHGKVIAYLVAHIEEEVVTDPSPVEESQQAVEDVEEELDMFLEEEEQEVEVDAGELACETNAGPNYEPDPSLDDLEFEDYINDLRRQTVALGFVSN
jgi:antitoxin (DNA-binding transcriptional repressor) of toxin-antitoxin stability system